MEEVRAVSTRAQALAEAAQPIHPPPTSFWRQYVFSIDHKVIAKQFLWAGLLFLLLGGTLAMLIRWQWAFPYRPVPVLGQLFLRENGGVIGPATYQQIFTTHGLVMIFFAVTPVLIGCFGNFLIPLMIGARDMAFPKLNMYSFWTFLLSQLLVLASFLSDLGSAGAGWTTYPPLSTNVGTPGVGQTLVVAAIFVTGVSSTMGAINYVTTVIRMRAPGMGYMRLPLTMWGLWLTAILNALFVPVLGSAALLLLLDRNFGTQFFVAGASAVRGGGDPILFQHLFWIFGHPEVYILILPAIAMDLYLHDTMFVVGHFHFTMAAASFIAAMTGVYFWFPKIFGRKLDERLGKAHFWFTFVGITLVFGGQLLAGYAGQQRRLFDPFQYTFIHGLRGLNRWPSFFSFALFAGQFIFVWNFFKTLFGKAARAAENPWQVTTLEWTATGSPPPFHNFDRIPEVVRGPHEFSNPEVRRLTGRDFAGQSEVLPGSAGPALAVARG